MTTYRLKAPQSERCYFRHLITGSMMFEILDQGLTVSMTPFVLVPDSYDRRRKPWLMACLEGWLCAYPAPYNDAADCGIGQMPDVVYADFRVCNPFISQSTG